MEDITESCSSRAVDSYASSSWFSNNSRKLQRQKADIYLSVLCKLKELNVEEAWNPVFEDDLWAHFQKLPLRYALDVDVERADDVLMHKRLLDKARDPTNRPAIEVRLVQVPSASDPKLSVTNNPISPREATSQFSNDKSQHSKHPLPACGLQCNCEVKLEGMDSLVQDWDNSGSSSSQYSGPMHEIMISSNDKRKFLSQFTSLISEIELNIREAHAFCTIDGYSLDVFIVDGWKFEETQKLRTLLTEKMQKIESSSSSKDNASVNTCKQETNGLKDISNHVNVPAYVKDVWEIDVNLLYFEKKIAYGSYGELYKGTYHGQDVAIKFILAEHLSNVVLQEFTKEVSIMRRIHHKNIVQFIGACTRHPKLCIVTEFMSGGSVFDFLRKQKGVLKLSTILRLAIDVSQAMSYLHRKNIIHRDLKAANLLMDENNVVKVADFGVAKVKTETGVMTAETGTYRWMAPEVIEHKPYDHKVDVFSFGIVLWELLTGKIPYEDLTPLQAALGVVHKGLRPPIPRNTHPEVERLLNLCWQQEPYLRPEFSEILEFLQHLSREMYD